MPNSSHEKDQIIVGKCREEKVAYLKLPQGQPVVEPRLELRSSMLKKAFPFSPILTSLDSGQ